MTTNHDLSDKERKFIRRLEKEIDGLEHQLAERRQQLEAVLRFVELGRAGAESSDDTHGQGGAQ